VSTFPVMWSLMNTCFPLHLLHPPIHIHLLLFHLLLCLFNLKMLHTRLFCCLIMVQVLEEVLVLSCWTVHAALLLLLLMQTATSIAAWLMQSLRSTCARLHRPHGPLRHHRPRRRRFPPR
jgi:hypothetical protein